MKIKKVKYNGEVEITYFKKSASQEDETYTLKSADEPALEFNQVLQEMRNFIPALIGVPKVWAELVVVTGVTISYSDGEEFGLLISGKRRAPGREQYFCFNTPHTPFEEMPSFDADLDLYVVLTDLKKYAERYVRGSRAQQKLPFDLPKPINEMSALALKTEQLKRLAQEHNVTVSVH